MKHGKLMKQLRIERNLTQEALSCGITSRTALVNFEKGTSRPYFETIIAYLDRLNVRVTDYLFLLADSQPSKKEALSLEFFDSYYTDISKFNDMTRLFKEEYMKNNDKYYLFLAVQGITLTQLNFTNQLERLEPDDYALVQEYFHLLDQCESWSSLELSAFVTTLFLFDNETIDYFYQKILNQLSTRLNHHRTKFQLNALLINTCILFFQRENLTRIPFYLENLKNFNKNSKYLYEKTMHLFLDGIYLYKTGETIIGQEQMQKASLIFDWVGDQKEVDHLRKLKNKLIDSPSF